MQSYDMIVIGSGPAGQRAAIQGAKSGKRVAVVERRECVGGACINTGTIPSQNTARGGTASFRLRLPGRLRRQLPREREDHHGGSGLPGPARHQDRNRRHHVAAHPQQRRDGVRLRHVCRPAHHPGHQHQRRRGLPGRKRHHRHRNQAGGLAQGSLSTTATSSTAIRSCTCRTSPRPSSWWAAA